MTAHERPGWCANLIGAAQLRSGERVLVVVDEPLAEQGAELAAAVANAGGRPRLELWAGERPLSRPPAGTLEAAREAQVFLFLAQEPQADEASARFALGEAAREGGGRVIFLGFVDDELLRGELSAPPSDLHAAAEALLGEVSGCETVRIRGAAGTDLRLRVGGRQWVTDAGPLEAGGFANYPGGEVFVAPHQDGAGVLVVDLTVPYTVDGLVDEPVRVSFKAGRVTSIEGGRAAALLRELVAEAGPGGNVVAELGLGLNPAVNPRGHVMLDEKAAGTAHVAIGRSTGYGGDNAASIHVDMIFSSPSLEVDGRAVALP